MFDVRMICWQKGLQVALAVIVAEFWVTPFMLAPALTVNAQDIPASEEDKARLSSPEVRVEQFDDWALRCTGKPEESDAAPMPFMCEIAQPLMVDQAGKPVEILSLAVSRASDEPAGQNWVLVVLTPLDVHLASDLGLGIGTAVPVILRYRNCNHLGCFVTVPLSEERIRQMKKASEGTVFLRVLNGQLVRISFSLSGFTKAFEALTSGEIPRAIARDGKVAADESSTVEDAKQ